MVGEAGCHDFVNDEEGAELMCCFVEILEEVFVSNNATTTALNGLHENGC